MTLTIDQRCKLAADYLNILFKVNAPKRTLNLAINGINVVNDGNVWAVVIGGEVAPYAVYTNEPGITRKNPNANWIQNTIYQALPTLKIIFSGQYSTQDIRTIRSEMLSSKTTFKAEIKARIALINAGGKL